VVFFFVNDNVFFSQHILNKAKTHTGSILLFEVSFSNNLIVFITVMQNNRNAKFYIQRRNELLN